LGMQYRGEYDNLDFHCEKLRKLDMQMQAMFTDLCYPEITYDKNGKLVLEKPLDPMKEATFVIAHRTFLEILQEVDGIIQSTLDHIATPDTYFKTLPSNAKNIMKYDALFKNYAGVVHKIIGNRNSVDKRSTLRFDLKKYMQEAESEKKIVKDFLASMHIDYELIVQDPKVDVDACRFETKKLTDLLTKMEQIMAIWEDKKGHKDDSKKLSKMKNIHSVLRLIVPSFQSPLTIAKKTAKEDVANMVRIWYAEALLGRASALGKSVQKVLDVQHMVSL